MRDRWTERGTNEWVRGPVGVSIDNIMLGEVQKRRIRKYGHWKRRSDSLALTSIEEETEVKTKRGRRREEWMSNIITWQGGVNQVHRHAYKRR